mgnify:CR=1 FL=1
MVKFLTLQFLTVIFVLFTADIPLELFVILPMSLIVKSLQFNSILSLAIVNAGEVAQFKFESNIVEIVKFAPQATCVAIAFGILMANIKTVNNTITTILMPFSNIICMLIMYINFYMIE